MMCIKTIGFGNLVGITCICSNPLLASRSWGDQEGEARRNKERRRKTGEGEEGTRASTPGAEGAAPPTTQGGGSTGQGHSRVCKSQGRDRREPGRTRQLEKDARHTKRYIETKREHRTTDHRPQTRGVQL